jgi:hypothetical protein
MGRFGKKKDQKKRNDDDDIDTVEKFEIEIMLLEKIPQIENECIPIQTFDLHTNVLTIPSHIKEIKDPETGTLRKLQYPDYIFNLRKPVKEGEKSMESISLDRCLLPGLHVIAFKSIPSTDESVYSPSTIIGGQLAAQKLVFDLICFTKESMINANHEYEAYRKKIEELKIDFEEEKKEIRSAEQKRYEENDTRHKKIENDLATQLSLAQSENTDMQFKTTQTQYDHLKAALKKFNPLNS